jgi:phosphate transport system permease protein
VATSVPTAQPDGEAGIPPPRRLGGALSARLSNASPIRWVGLVGAVIPLLMLLFVLITLLIKAIPALEFSGFKLFTSSNWNFGSQYGTPVKTDGIVHEPGQSFGALPQILGTLATAVIALIIAVPVSIGAALVIVERLPRRLASLLGIFLELLAGVPSVIVGLWGVLTFGPFIAHDIAPFISDNAPSWLPFLKGDTGHGQGLLTSGMVLAVMVIPIIASTARDLIRSVPILPREGAMALGMSDFQTARKVTLPWVGAGLVGAIVLGLGRALGETIAVAMICGVAISSLPTNLYADMITIAANLVQNLETAIVDKMDISAFAALALILLAITLLANVVARLLVRRVSGTALPVGRGL